MDKTNSSEPVISLVNLQKSYGDFQAVKGINLSIGKGEIFGLLGPNGAGKTTTISMMSLLMNPTGGQIQLFGEPANKSHKPQLGLVPQELALYDELNAFHHLEFFGSLYGLSPKQVRSRSSELLSFVGLEDRAKDPVKAYSGGMKRRLNLACALVHRPKILFLDEPTVGVDPQSRNHIFERILQLRDQGVTLIYTTHYMEEVERLCDRIAIMDSGKILAAGSQAELINNLGGSRRVEAEPEQESELPEILGQAGFHEVREPHRPLCWVRSVTRLEELEESMGLLRQSGKSLARIQVKENSLEEVFLELTGSTLRD